MRQRWQPRDHPRATPHNAAPGGRHRVRDTGSRPIPVDRIARANQATNGTDGDARASDARFTAHETGVVRTTVQCFHGVPSAYIDAAIVRDFAVE